LKASLTQSEDTHFLIWPGVPVPDRLSSKFAKGLQWKEANSQSVWLEDASLPTSLVISYLAWAATHVRRAPADRTKAIQCIQHLLELLLRDGVTLRHQPFGQANWVERKFDSSGCTSSDFFWCQATFEGQIAPVWAEDLHSASKPWLTEPAADFQSLADYIAFALDPKHDREIKPELQGRVFSLLSQVAAALDSRVESLAASSAELTSRHRKKGNNRGAMPVSMLQDIAELLWSHEVLLQQSIRLLCLVSCFLWSVSNLVTLSGACWSRSASCRELWRRLVSAS